MKFLVIRLSSIGDIVMTTPLIRCLSLQLPGAEVHFLTGSYYKNILQANPYVHAVHAIREKSGEVTAQLTSENFDYVIDLQNDGMSRDVIAELKRPVLAYDELSFRKFLFTRLKWNLMPRGEHVVDRYLKTVSSLGVINDGN